MKFDRILNINDNETSRYALTKMIQHAGFEVIEEETGLGGIERARSCEPTVILLDIKLPDIDGFEVCRRLKTDPRTSSIPVLHVTAHALGTDKKIQSIEDGADAYLAFPVDRTYLIAMLRSLIRLHRAEREREQFFNDLGERNGQLSVALDELRGEKTLREHFVATLSHDLRNPLVAIRMASEIARRQLGQPELVGAQLEKIIQMIDRADRMIQDFLDVNLLRAGQKLPLQAREADLRQIAKETIDEFSARFGDRFVLRAQTPVEGCCWDPRAIRRVLENLLQNAIKYGAPDEKVTVSLFGYDDSVRISIHNWGNPISDENRARIFAPYGRGLAAKNAGTAGWGLGLALVQGVVDAHGGSIRLESAQEQGTTFIIDLPKRTTGLVINPDFTKSKKGTIEHEQFDTKKHSS